MCLLDTFDGAAALGDFGRDASVGARALVVIVVVDGGEFRDWEHAGAGERGGVRELRALSETMWFGG